MNIEQLLQSFGWEKIISIILVVVYIINWVLKKIKGTSVNEVTKLLDQLIIMGEQTGLVGVDKKQWVVDQFKQLKIKNTKVDVGAYIDGAVKVANTINVKMTDIQKAFNETLTETVVEQSISADTYEALLTERNEFEVAYHEVNDKLDKYTVEANRIKEENEKLTEANSNLLATLNIKDREIEELKEKLSTATNKNALLVEIERLNKLIKAKE